MAYFTLVTRNGEGSPFNPQFGDYDRETVEQEMYDSYSNVKRSDRKIIKTKTAAQHEINRAIVNLNIGYQQEMEWLGRHGL